MNNELYHHGVQGMKWGVRKYQDKNGNLTAEGQRKYGGQVALGGLGSTERVAKSQSYASNHTALRMVGAHFAKQFLAGAAIGFVASSAGLDAATNPAVRVGCMAAGGIIGVQTIGRLYNRYQYKYNRR